jgi:hypothetical protein
MISRFELLVGVLASVVCEYFLGALRRGWWWWGGGGGGGGGGAARPLRLALESC